MPQEELSDIEDELPDMTKGLPELAGDLPEYMSMREFGQYVGLSHFLTRRFCDRNQIPLKQDGVSKKLEVRRALGLLAHDPNIEKLLEPGSRLRQVVEAMYRSM
jgi:hypothetical protein